MTLTSIIVTLFTIISFASGFSCPNETKANSNENDEALNKYLYGDPNPVWLNFVNKNGLIDPLIVDSEVNHTNYRKSFMSNLNLLEYFYRLHIKQDYDAANAVKFYLYTNNERTRRQIILEDLSSIKSSSFNSAHPTRFIIHGWLNDDSSEVVQKIKDAYLHKGNFNVFSVDWGNGSDSVNYYISRHRIEAVASVATIFIEFIVKNMGVNITQIHLIGHSLGAHIAGFIGKRIIAGRIPVIVGLDAALPLFSHEEKHNRLDASDAEHVEVIHTAAGSLGFDKPIGKIDFYPNYGKMQKGCAKEIIGICPHARAFEFFAESITTEIGFWAKQCGDYCEIEQGKCVETGKMALFGGEPMKSESKDIGIYYFETNSDPPFAQGK